MVHWICKKCKRANTDIIDEGNSKCKFCGYPLAPDIRLIKEPGGRAGWVGVVGAILITIWIVFCILTAVV